MLAINAGGSSLSSKTYGFEFSKDQYCSGGDVLETKEVISQTREPFFYQTARHGNVSYAIPNLLRGHYVVNLHFAEIVFTSGPPGMRVFDISIQGHKVTLSLTCLAFVLLPHCLAKTFVCVCGSPACITPRRLRASWVK